MFWNQILGSFNNHCSFLKLLCLQNNLQIGLLYCILGASHRQEREKWSSDLSKKLKPRALKWQLPIYLTFTSCMLSFSWRIPSFYLYTSNCLLVVLLRKSCALKYQSTLQWNRHLQLTWIQGIAFRHSSLLWPLSAHVLDPPCFYTSLQSTLPDSLHLLLSLRKLAPAAYLMADCSLLRSWLKCHLFIEDSVQLKQNRLLVTSLSCFPFSIIGIAAVYLPIARLSTRMQASPAWTWSGLLTDTYNSAGIVYGELQASSYFIC